MNKDMNIEGNIFKQNTTEKQVTFKIENVNLNYGE